MQHSSKNYLPTLTIVPVDALPMQGALVQIDAIVSNGIGTLPQDPCNLIKVANNSDNTPTSSVSTQTVAFSHYNNISGQLPINSASGAVVEGVIKEQAVQCLQNVKPILESIDVPFDDIVKLNIFLKNISNVESVNQVYTSFFPDSTIARTAGYVPTRTIFAVAALPMDALIQIDAVVSYGNRTPPQAIEDRHNIVVRANNTDNAPNSSLSLETVGFSHYDHLSGQLPIHAKTNEKIAGGAREQTTQCMKNIQAIAESIHHSMDDILKVNIQLKDMADLDVVNEAYISLFKSELPARTTIGVAAIPADALVQIDAILSNAEDTPA